MRKNVIIPVVFIITAVVSVAAVIIIGTGYKQDGLLFSGKTAAFTEGWTTADGTPVNLPGALPDNGNGMIELFNTLPPILEENSTMYINSYYQSVEVYVDGVNIYTWNLNNKAFFKTPYGLSSYFITIPATAAGKPIELKLLSAHPGADISIYSLTLGSGFATLVSVIEHNVDGIMQFFLLTVLFVLISFFAFLFRKRITGQVSADAFYLSAFIALSAIWMLTGSVEMLLFTTNIAATQYCYLFSAMLMPVPLILFLRRFIHRGKRILNALAVLFLLDFIICLGLLFFGAADLIQTLFTSRILRIATFIIILVLSVKEFAKYKRRDTIEIIVGITLLFLLMTGSAIMFTVNGTPADGMFTRLGVTSLIVSLAFGVIRRGFNELSMSAQYVNLTMSIPGGVCRIDNFYSGTIIFANEFYYRMFGYSEAEAINAGFTSIDYTVLAEDLSVMKDKIKNYFAINLSRFETEARHIRKDGEIVWILSRYRMDPNKSGNITVAMIDITDRKQTEEKLRISEEEYRIATRHSNKLIFRYDIHTKTLYSQFDKPSIYGLGNIVENVPDSIIASGIISRDSVEAFKRFFDSISSGNREGSAVISIFDRSSGAYKWYQYDFTSIFDDNGAPVQAIVIFFDITLQRQKELAFQKWQQSFNSIPKSATNYFEYNLTVDYFEHEEGEMIPSIPAGVPRTLFDMSLYIAEKYVYPDDTKLWLDFMDRERLLEKYSEGIHALKTEFRRIIDGTPLWTSLNVQLIPDPYSSDVKGFFLLEDIDAQKKEVIHLQERSTHDSLTGLLNRGAFVEKINEVLSTSGPETQHALIMLDIDNFKTINDTLGHDAGDALLINISSKLKYVLRSEDVCGRLGGDEFVICLRNINYGKPLENRIIDLCNLICDEQVWGIPVSASFGISGFPNDGQTFDELYKKADIALYKAKSDGRGGYALYDPQLSFDDITVPFRQS